MDKFSKELESLINYSRELEKQADAMFKESQIMRSEAKEAKQKAFDLMYDNGVIRSDTASFRISLRKSPAVVHIIDKEKLPEQAFVIRKEISKKIIKELINKGESVPGAEIKQDGFYLAVTENSG